MIIIRFESMISYTTQMRSNANANYQNLGKKLDGKKSESVQQDLNPLLIPFHTREPKHSATTFVAASSRDLNYFIDKTTQPFRTNPANHSQPSPRLPIPSHPYCSRIDKP